MFYFFIFLKQKNLDREFFLFLFYCSIILNNYTKKKIFIKNLYGAILYITNIYQLYHFPFFSLFKKKQNKKPINTYLLDLHAFNLIIFFFIAFFFYFILLIFNNNRAITVFIFIFLNSYSISFILSKSINHEHHFKIIFFFTFLNKV